MGGNLLHDADWARIRGDVCRVERFTLLAGRTGGLGTSRALVALRGANLPPGTIGAIAHRTDVAHLTAAFAARDAAAGEEVLLAWVKRPGGWLARFRPGLAVMLCRAGAHALLSNPAHRPDLTGEARFLAERPIVQWRPQDG